MISLYIEEKNQDIIIYQRKKSYIIFSHNITCLHRRVQGTLRVSRNCLPFGK